jgi:aspartate/tyrosine/aromatic aminotransferase
MFFDEVPEGAPDAIFGLGKVFERDARPHKVNLMVGIYKDEQSRSELMHTVKKAKAEILESDGLSDYLSMDGLPDFCSSIGSLMLGEKGWVEHQSRIYSAQAIGGTGALRIGGEFIAQEVGRSIAISNPTWPNHRSVFERIGFQVSTYDYYSKQKRGFDLDAMLASLRSLPEKTAVLLHTSCHNPTGCDPSREDWKIISELLLQRKLLPFFDCAYQGFGDGLEMDTYPIQLFLKQGHEALIAYSCSKNFSLYCQRVGALFIAGESAAAKFRIGTQIKRIIRTNYSNPPAHGARIAAHILKNPSLKAQWEKELGEMRRRLTTLREKLAERLTTHFLHLRNHKGMFSYLNLDQAEVQRLIDEFAVYTLDGGRINIAGLNDKNLGYVADSLIRVSGR